MSPSENEDDTKVNQDHEPLCLFYYPQTEEHDKPRETYLSSTRGSEPSKTQKLAEGQGSTRGGPWNLPPPRRIQQRAPSSSDETTGQVRSRRTEPPRRANVSTTLGRRHRESHYQRKSRVKRFGKEPVHHLASYLLSSVKPAPIPKGKPLPLLTHVLETITDAWPTSRNLDLNTNNDPTMIEHESLASSALEVPCHVLARRRSVPEEIIRKFSVTSERTSESEANITMPEMTSPSSKDSEELKEANTTPKKNEDTQAAKKLRAKVFSKRIEEDNWPMRRLPGQRSFRLVEDPEIVRSAEEGSSDSDSDAPGMARFNTIKRAPLRRGSVVDGSLPEPETPVLGSERASQSDYYRNGQGILKISAAEKSSQTGECTCRSPHNDSGTTPSAREETESGESSDSISSPRLCTQPLSSSDNQSSDSEGIRCTCAEMTSSKDTSTDPNHSGKSTLSQTVSDKSTSTQDSTASINSVSSRGSSISVATDSSSTDVDPRTSAKETTTSPDHTPRSPPGRRRPEDHDKSGKDGNKDMHSQPSHCRHCPQHKPSRAGAGGNNGPPQRRTHQAQAPIEEKETSAQTTNTLTQAPPPPTTVARSYEWAQLSEEELCLIQQQRHQKFIENNRNFESPMTLRPVAAASKVSVCTSTGSCYKGAPDYSADLPLMVPRYSALPRTMSMVVNSSSFEANHFSDSDCPSLADSLEDGHNRLDPSYFDTKQELKPVRGDIEQALAERNIKMKHNQPRGRAYFFSIDEGGSAELVTNIHKIPELPDEIKNKIHERHINISKSHEEKQDARKEALAKTNGRHRLVKRKSKVSKVEGKKQEPSQKLVANTTPPTTRVSDLKTPNAKVSSVSNGARKPTQDQQARNAKASPKFLSKIPQPINDVTEKGLKSQLEVSQVSKRGKETPKDHERQNKTPRKPQAVIHPSLSGLAEHPTPSKPKTFAPSSEVASSPSQPAVPSIDLEAVARHHLALISSLESTASALKAQKNTQRQWNRPQPAAKRPSKFQQRFEVIPEERSSSLTSSAEEHRSEKSRRRSLPVKLTEPTISPRLLTNNGEAGNKSFRRYSLGSLSSYVIAKLMGRPLQAIPCVQRGPNNENQQIIIFSPKEPPGTNSSKGRDALLAMNREDFNRLSKGWMNFYLLKESSDSENDGEDASKKKPLEVEKENGNSETKLAPDANTIVCRIPSMEKDPPTTSGSGTDETCGSPGLNAPPLQLDISQLNKSYSLLLKNPETNCFQLQECPTDPDITQQLFNSTEGENKEIKRNNLSFISEEPEPVEPCSPNKSQRVLAQKDASTEIDETLDPLVAKEDKTTIRRLTKEASTSTEKKAESKNNRLTDAAVKLSAPIKLGSSNTVLTTKKQIKISPRKTPKSSGRACSLPELRVDQQKKPTPVKTQSLVDSLPRVPGASSESDDTNSDSTEYLHAPSPQLPRLPLEDCCDYYSDSDSSTTSASGRVNATTAQRERQYVPLRRRPLPFRPKNRFGIYESVHGKKPGNSGWSVTVEGTLAFPRTRPDVQMRLSFPTEAGPPFVSQSDSGFAEDREPKSRPTTQQKQQWTVTVQNPQSGNNGKDKQKSACQLPNLSQHPSDRNTKRGSKGNVTHKTGRDQAEIERKLSKIWPKVQKVLESELKNITGDLMDSQRQDEEPLLSMEGRAVSFDTKPRVPKMSERDVTRNSTARSEQFKRGMLPER